ncbi:MAG: hypothetical protein ABI639_17040 [Thermoanaerobaculia bacterium]
MALIEGSSPGSLDVAFDGDANSNGVVNFQLTDILGLALDQPNSLVGEVERSVFT